MVDYVRIKIKAGDGGAGAVSFRKLRGKAHGPPDGGDGGNGGDVLIKASKNLSTLTPFQFKKNFKGGSGEPGGKSMRKGASGGSLILEVPLGTLVKDTQEEVVGDLAAEGDELLVAKGGKGGRGNAHLSRSENKALRALRSNELEKLRMNNEKITGEKEGRWEYLKHAEKGGEGEEIELVLELRVLAEVGLIGLPNAGKSTLLSKLTAATPKIANYPFTTLEPNLGVMTLGGRVALNPKPLTLVIADIPGLIEGASQGRGLGDQFLKHIERTKVLVHLLDATSPNPYKDYLVVRNELKSYNPSLVEKKEIVVVNKIDLLTEEELKEKLANLVEKGLRPLDISALNAFGLEE